MERPRRSRAYIGAKIAKLDAAEIEASRHGEPADAKAAAVPTFATAMVRTRGGVEEAGIKTAQAVGLTDGESTEVIANVALDVFTNYLNKAVDTDTDWPVVRHHEH
ncbi:hypothetical protein [Nocardia amikacinitolerans]|uniref:hypothetical protein n=1 Tax=Nocardia amikacinitolerans TaxID=756689 RepID=UPI001C3F781B|nr:hypothetical protein [Nocardia amikacinitolerans]